MTATAAANIIFLNFIIYSSIFSRDTKKPATRILLWLAIYFPEKKGHMEGILSMWRLIASLNATTIMDTSEWLASKTQTAIRNSRSNTRYLVV